MLVCGLDRVKLRKADFLVVCADLCSYALAPLICFLSQVTVN